MVKTRFLGATALRSATALGLAIGAVAPAYAQDALEETPATEAPATQDEGLVVTGSRISGVTPFNSPDPISVIDPTLETKAGKSDIASMLQSSPIASGSTQITSAISSNFVTNGGPGAQNIDLRGLGPNRTLVLLNGRRAGPAGTRGGVSSFDLNVLPASIAQKIDILKTGASSIYGSDAVAGVVNIITKTDTDGLELVANVSAPFDSGGEQYRLSAIWGKTFERGHVLFAADYTHTNELRRGDRDYLACPEAYTFRPDGSRADLIDPRTGNYKCEDLRWGHVWTYNLIDNLQLDGPGGPNTGVNTSPNGETVLLQYQYPGETLGIPAYGAPAYAGDIGVPAGWYPTGYSTAALAVQNAYHPFVEEQSIIPKTDIYTAYLEGSYEVSDAVEVFGEFLWNRRETYQNGWRQFWAFGGSSDFLSNYWAPGWTGVTLLSPTGITNLSDSSQSIDYWRGVGGLRGEFGGFMPGWKWEIYGQYSKSVGRYRTQQILQEIYDYASYQGFGSLGSCVGITLPISGKQCMDLPWMDPFFLRGELTQAQGDFLTSWEEGRTQYTQLTFEGSLSGTLVDLPAGPLALAVGATIRTDTIYDSPGEITQAGNAWGTSTSGVTAGRSVAKEAFGEINVPVLADVPFFHELTLSGAARVTQVSSTRYADGANDQDKGNWTYKIGANWALTDFLRLRASYGTSFRAPALFEQFITNETSSARQIDIDPCINYTANLALGNISQTIANNCAADGIPGNHLGGGVSADVVKQGGIGILDPETSKALVVGAVLTPRFNFLPNTRINIAVDYFDIRVRDEVTQLQPSNILLGCYSSLNFATEPLCDLFTRGQTGAPFNVATVRDRYVNIASQKNSGIDLAINISQNLGSLGTLNFLADMTWQTRDNSQLLPSSREVSTNGEVGSPRWIGDFNLTWTMPSGFSIYYGLDVIGSADDYEDFLEDQGSLCLTSTTRGVYCPKLDVPAVFYHNVSLSQEIDDRFEITLGISNIFDTRPPRVSVVQGTPAQITMLGPVVAASQYPFTGRRAFLNVSAKF